MFQQQEIKDSGAWIEQILAGQSLIHYELSV